jgi:two-component system, response regulator
MSKRVLLVEDNPDDVELTLRSFKKSGLADSVAVARDGEEALDYLFGLGRYAGRPADPLPEVILLDMKMPKLGGLEVLQRLRSHARTAAIPVVVMVPTEGEKGRVDGAAAYVVKPVDHRRFLEVLRHLGLDERLPSEQPS